MAFRLVRMQFTIATTNVPAPAAIQPMAVLSSKPLSAAVANPTTTRALPAMTSNLDMSAL
jgi:hypothetical protein